MSAQITLRPWTRDDLDFLFQVYAGTREGELAILDWTSEQKYAFIKMQFEAQHKYYHENWPKASYLIIEDDERPVGRLYVDRRPKEIRIIDIALIKEARNKGIGGRLITRLIDEARETKLPLTIHVEEFNPARNLYDRLGFKHVSDQLPYILMEWKSES